MLKLYRAFALILLMAVALGPLPVSAQAGDQIVALDTTKGRIVIRVYYSMVPYTAGRFLQLVDSGFYNGLIFHRVENWVIQGGDPNGNGSGSYVDPNTGQPSYLRLEINRALNHNQAGMVAMARSANPNSASCQFYILKRSMPQLNGQYAVFGQLIDGARAVMSMQPGDRILSAQIITPGGNGGGANSDVSNADPVPYVSEGPPAAAAASPPTAKPSVPTPPAPQYVRPRRFAGEQDATANTAAPAIPDAQTSPADSRVRHRFVRTEQPATGAPASAPADTPAPAAPPSSRPSAPPKQNGGPESGF